MVIMPEGVFFTAMQSSTAIVDVFQPVRIYTIRDRGYIGLFLASYPKINIKPPYIICVFGFCFKSHLPSLVRLSSCIDIKALWLSLGNWKHTRVSYLTQPTKFVSA